MDWKPFIFSKNNTQSPFGPIMYIGEEKLGHDDDKVTVFDHSCEFWVSQKMC